MAVFISCKNEEDPIKNEGARVVTTFLQLFSRCSKTANSTVCGWIWPKFELIQDFMVALITCKNEEDPIKNEGATILVLTRFSPLNPYGSYLLPWKPEF